MLETMRCIVNQDVFTGTYWATLLGGEFDNCYGSGDSESSAIHSLRIRIHQLRHKKICPHSRCIYHSMHCITFDKSAQDNLPEHIKEKMKADRELARAKQDMRDLLERDLQNWRNSMGYRQWIYCYKGYQLEYLDIPTGTMERNCSKCPVMNTGNWRPATKEEIIAYYEKNLL